MEQTKILIVDAKRRSLQTLVTLLQDPDLALFAETSSEAALDLARAHEFALVVISTHSTKDHGGGTGLGLAGRLRAEGSQNRHTPIIFVAGQRRAKEVIFDGYEQGAVDVLIRPLEPHIVASKIRVFVELYRSRQTIKKKLVEVRRLAAAAEKANHLKSRFLANISHEIRTPLSAILGHAELLYSHDPPKDEQREYLGSILQNGAMLTEILNNVLDISKIEAGLLRVERHSFPLDELLDDMQRTFGREAQQKGVTLTIRREVPPVRVTSDPTRLRQILYNVVGNALKFTSRGEVEVVARMQAGLLEFTVKDSGCGLSESDIEALFKPFTQADASTTRRYGGTGLGLSIARHLAGALGGGVRLVETAFGRGTTFAVTIDPTPVLEDVTQKAVELRPAAPAAVDTRLDNVRVLMVEDSKHIRSFVRRVLELSGARVDEADGGEQALALVTDAQAYDVILMDIQMPGMDGFEATRRLRERGLTLPIVAFTAHALKEERDRCLEGGFDTHITKPIEHRKLIHTLATLTRPTLARSAGTPHAGAHAGGGLCSQRNDSRI